MTLKKTEIDMETMSKEAMVLYYLFIDEQLLCAWWDYLDYWNAQVESDEDMKSEDFMKKLSSTMMYVEYWEDILDQLKERVTFQDIEEYLLDNPNIKKSFLFTHAFSPSLATSKRILYVITFKLSVSFDAQLASISSKNSFRFFMFYSFSF